MLNRHPEHVEYVQIGLASDAPGLVVGELLNPDMIWLAELYFGHRVATLRVVSHRVNWFLELLHSPVPMPLSTPSSQSQGS